MTARINAERARRRPGYDARDEAALQQALALGVTAQNEPLKIQAETERAQATARGIMAKLGADQQEKDQERVEGIYKDHFKTEQVLPDNKVITMDNPAERRNFEKQVLIPGSKSAAFLQSLGATSVDKLKPIQARQLLSLYDQDMAVSNAASGLQDPGNNNIKGQPLLHARIRQTTSGDWFDRGTSGTENSISLGGAMGSAWNPLNTGLPSDQVAELTFKNGKIQRYLLSDLMQMSNNNPEMINNILAAMSPAEAQKARVIIFGQPKDLRRQ